MTICGDADHDLLDFFSRKLLRSAAKFTMRILSANCSEVNVPACTTSSDPVEAEFYGLNQLC